MESFTVWVLEGTTPYENVHETEIFNTEEKAETRKAEILKNKEYNYCEDWDIYEYEVD